MRSSDRKAPIAKVSCVRHTIHVLSVSATNEATMHSSQLPKLISKLTRLRSSELGVCPMLSVSVIIFEICDMQFWWPWTRTVQGHRMSKVMMSIQSPFMVSYLTSIVSNNVSVMVFEISDAEVLSHGSKTVQGHPRSKVMAPINSPWATSYSTSIDPNCICHHFWNIRSVILTTLKDSSRSFKVKGHGANR